MRNFSVSKLRLPLLPFEKLLEVNNPQKLIDCFKDPILREAVYLASPVLYDEIIKNGADINNNKLLLSLTKYLQRSVTRCTPFGLFASCSAIEVKSIVSKGKTIKLNDRRHSRLDMNYLCSLAKFLANHPAIMPHLLFYPNTSVYKIHDKIRFTEYNYINGRRLHQLSIVDDSPFLQLILKESINGLTFNKLKSLLTELNVSEEDAESYLTEIISSQVLVSNLEPSLTGEEYMEQILHFIVTIEDDKVKRIARILKNCQEQILKIDKSPLGIDPNCYRKIGETLKELNVEFDWKYLFQIDLHRDVDLEVSNKLAEDVWNGLKILGNLSIQNENPNLKIFKEAFFNRYENEEVPLIEVLDSENGLGYPYFDRNENDISPMLEGIPFRGKLKSNSNINWNPTHSLLLTKINHAFQNNQNSIEITDEDLKDFKFDEDKMQDTISTLINITEFDTEKDKYTILLSGAGGSSAVNLLSRFCHGDNRIKNLAEQIILKEDELNSDIIFAEVIHLPEDRIGNIVLHPVLRKYEIAYLAKSGVTNDYRIALSDLMLSIKSDKLILRSKRLNKLIIPRLSNAHNFSLSKLPIYTFLCELQSHYNTGFIGLDLRFFENQLSYIPRIFYKNFIFSEARWKFKRKELEYLFKINENELLFEVGKFISKNKLPRRMLLPDGDNELFIDWMNILSVKCLFSVVKNREEIVLKEFLFNSDKPFIKGQTGTYTNELLLCYHKEKKNILLTEKFDLKQIKPVNKINKRMFFPGEEWLFLKIYSGVKTCDKILVEKLEQIISQLEKNKVIEKWFFIRYSDPKHHIRFRILLSEKSNHTNVLKLIYAHLADFCEDGLISKITIDTYNREVERYGSDCIELTETLFQLDSRLCLKLIKHLDSNEGDNMRWKIAMLVVDSYFKSFRLSSNEIISFINNCIKDFENEFNMQKNEKVKIDMIYRENRQHIADTLSENDKLDTKYSLFVEIINDSKKQFDKVAIELQEVSSKEEVMKYLKSYIHMSVNRFFRSKQRSHEFMIYEYLNRYYISEVAKTKRKALSNEIKI